MERASFSSGVQFAWDSTSIELAQTCLRKYYYRMVENIVPRNTSVHLLFGGIYAKALEHFYLYRSEGDDIDVALRRIVREALEASWDQETGAPVEFNDNAKTRMNLIRSLVWYVDQFANESEDGITTYQLANGKPAVELSFTLEVNDDLVFCGHLDRVVEYGGQLYWMDQKTTNATISPYFFERFKPSNQVYLYTWAGKAILERPLQGGIIDGAQIAVGFTRFERQPIPVHATLLEEWLNSTLYTIREAQKATRENNFPMNLTACGNYGGCPYRTLCTRAPSIRHKFIEGDYVHPSQPWDPIKPR
jgi:hypothetical protein